MSGLQRSCRRISMSGDYIVVGAISTALLVYLLFCLLHPERL